MITKEDLKGAIPNLTGTAKLKGLSATVEVYRDRWGIPHARAENELDAFSPKDSSPHKTVSGTWSTTGAGAAADGRKWWERRRWSRTS